MKITQDKFKQALQRYLFEQVVPSVGNVSSQFLIGMAYGAMENQIVPKMRVFGLVCDDDMIDTDVLERAVMHGFKASKDKFPLSLLGHTFTFKPDDWAAFKRMI